MFSDYQRFIESKCQYGADYGFEPIFMPPEAFDFQSHLIDWSVRKGRAAIFADCGMGKTLMQLAWAQNVVEKENRPVLIATPIAVGAQTVAEADRFHIKAARTRHGKFTGESCIWVTNYEQLHKYDPSAFAGFVGDESSCVKDFKSQRKDIVSEFTRQIPYRLLCTATAAPNDYWELGTSSEVLGYLGFRDMITNFFKQETSKDWRGWGRTKYRFRGHAEQPFWSWVCSWARSLQRPSDLGFDDSRFVLPELREKSIVVKTETARSGSLFTVPAQDIREERAERRRSLRERCEAATEIAESVPGQTALWCELNPEGDLLENMLDDCVQVTGSTSDEEKEEAFLAFSRGQIRRLVTKPKIGAWGMNWQNCANVVCFPSHSYEQYYQLIRRCYRYGQTKPVDVTAIVCEGEAHILRSLRRKQAQASKMFVSLVAHMHDAMRVVSSDVFSEKEKVPSWLLSTR